MRALGGLAVIDSAISHLLMHCSPKYCSTRSNADKLRTPIPTLPGDVLHTVFEFLFGEFFSRLSSFPTRNKLDLSYPAGNYGDTSNFGVGQDITSASDILGVDCSNLSTFEAIHKIKRIIMKNKMKEMMYLMKDLLVVMGVSRQWRETTNNKLAINTYKQCVMGYHDILEYILKQHLANVPSMLHLLNLTLIGHKLRYDYLNNEQPQPIPVLVNNELNLKSDWLIIQVQWTENGSCKTEYMHFRWKEVQFIRPSVPSHSRYSGPGFDNSFQIGHLRFKIPYPSMRFMYCAYQVVLYAFNNTSLIPICWSSTETVAHALSDIDQERGLFMMFHRPMEWNHFVLSPVLLISSDQPNNVIFEIAVKAKCPPMDLVWNRTNKLNGAEELKDSRLSSAITRIVARGKKNGIILPTSAFGDDKKIMTINENMYILAEKRMYVPTTPIRLKDLQQAVNEKLGVRCEDMW